MLRKVVLLPGAGEDHPSRLQHIPSIRDPQRLKDVLLHQEHSRALRVDLRDGVEDGLHQKRGEAEAGLVE
ncbi:MAG TPA: hypothetical protein VF993_12280, partial [Myxococcales bacterium]